MTQPTIELKPCPFCGSKAELIDDYSGELCWFDLGCGEPYCPAHRVYSGQAVITRDKAIATWNTRAALTEKGWQPIETAPRDGTVVLGIDMRGDRKGFYHEFIYSEPLGDGFTHWSPEAGWRSNPGKDWPAYPTHWQPLPQPPNAAKDGAG